MRTSWAAAAAALTLSAGQSPALAQPAPPSTDGPACVYDALTPGQRQTSADLYIWADTEAPAFKAMVREVQALGMACVAANRWDYPHGNLSIQYAAYRAMFERIDQANVAAGLAPGRLKAAWQALPAGDRADLLDDDAAWEIAREVTPRLAAPRGAKLTHVREALVALSQVEAIEGAWGRP